MANRLERALGGERGNHHYFLLLVPRLPLPLDARSADGGSLCFAARVCKCSVYVCTVRMYVYMYARVWQLSSGGVGETGTGSGETASEWLID